MDFEKLKRAAKETLRIMSAKEDEPRSDTDETIEEPVTAGEAEDHSDTENELMGSTQRIDFKTILEKFRTKPEEVTATGEPEETASIPVAAEAMDELAKTVDEIDKRTEEITIAADENSEKLSASLVSLKSDFGTSVDEIRNELDELRKLVDRFSEKTCDSHNSIITKLNNTEKKIEKLTNSLSGVAKINDSIFDLKNSQMNTKNTLGDLEASFYKLKKKMFNGIMLISIIAAVIAVLEIINLLS